MFSMILALAFQPEVRGEVDEADAWFNGSAS
jgi:hypothetical protein